MTTTVKNQDVPPARDHACEKCGPPRYVLSAEGRSFARAIEERVVERLRGELRDIVVEQVKPVREALDREVPNIREFVEVNRRTASRLKARTGILASLMVEEARTLNLFVDLRETLRALSVAPAIHRDCQVL